MSLRTFLVTALPLFVWLVPAPSAQHATRELARSVNAAVASQVAEHSVRVQGVVVDPTGAPIVGAVVVSDVGGQAVTNAAGRYELALRVAVETKEVHLTAAEAGGSASTALPLPRGTSSVSAPVLVLIEGSPSAPQWLPTFGGQSGTDHIVEVFEVFDDGSGPALYAGGWFETAGGASTGFLARWNGQKWSDVGGTLEDNVGSPVGVRALEVFDDGTGPALYVGGNFRRAGNKVVQNIARWDGSSWSSLINGTELYGTVLALKVFDDGTGEALYVGGDFDTVSGVPAANIAKWDGSAWSSLGAGTDRSVDTIAIYDGGYGASIHIGGFFTMAGGKPAMYVARWDGTDWQPLNRGTNGWVVCFQVFDDGAGEQLYAGGYFTVSDEQLTPHIARWDGTGWSPVGPVLGRPVKGMGVFDDGSGPALYVGGNFDLAGGVPMHGVARWDGGSWSSLSTGLNPDGFASGEAFAVWDDGHGPALFVGGDFPEAGGVPASNVARWDGAAWSSLENGLDGAVYAVTTHDDGMGPELYAGGVFVHGSGDELNHVGRWNGFVWQPLGAGVDGDVNALCSFDDGNGPALYAGGEFTMADGAPAANLAMWDGTGWSEVGGGLDGPVLGMLVYDDGSGSALYVAGFFQQAGALAAASIVRWDGSSWSNLGPIGSGVTSGGGGIATARALAAWDDGSGLALYVAGSFSLAGGVSSRDLARWDGSDWSIVGTGISSSGAYALAVHDDGTGEALYLGGQINQAGGMPVNHLARWDGTNWSGVGGGVGSAFVEIRTLASFDVGNGPVLFAGGDFLTAGGTAARHVARWTPAAGWRPLGSSLQDSAYAMHVHDDGFGPSLYIGGTFGSAANSGDSYLARWGRRRGAPTGTVQEAGAPLARPGSR